MQTKPTLLLGVTGGIAAYKVAELIRLLIKAEIEVQVVMTKAATQFVTPTTLQALSGKPVLIKQWDMLSDNTMPHIQLSRQADAILIAPASADFIAKLTHGAANDLLSTLCLARACPLMIAPAMNTQMWDNPATQRNLAQIKQDNIIVLGPASGEQACGEVGLGRMLEPAQLLNAVQAHFTPKLLKHQKILITAGATLEMIDPVRGITNLSSGKMGYALAKVAANMGAEVTLVSGISQLSAPDSVNTLYANNADSMYQAVMRHIGKQNVFISVAAVADYRPLQIAVQKIKKSEQSLTLELQRNKDILAEVASLPNPPYCVGFSAETEQLIVHATQKRLAKKIPMMVANHVGTAMGSDNNQVTIIDEQGTFPLPLADKVTIAMQILQHLSAKLSAI